MGLSVLVLIVLVGASLLLNGCATSFDKRGRYHRVRHGDSIWRIAKSYRVDVQELAEFNNILHPADVQPGMRIYMPDKGKKGGYKKLPFGQDVAAPPGKRGRYAGRRGNKYSKPIKTYRGRFIWPVDGQLSSPFGMRNGRRHDGIDIRGRTGTPIKAAAKGKVVFSGKMRGYGNIILVRHSDDFFSAYAHNNRNRVKKGQEVKQGQVIGDVGRTGRATGSHLHFEIRHGQTARNPLFFLPERRKKG